MRFRSPRSRRRAEVAIDITSLVDVVFLLLIFLLVTTTFKRDEHAFPIELPTSSMEQVTVTTDKTTIFITRDGDLHLLTVPGDLAAGGHSEGERGGGPAAASSEPVSEVDLQARLEALRARRPDAPIAIRGEKETSFQRMIDVVAMVEGAGFTNIFFPYEKADGEGGEGSPPPPRGDKLPPPAAPP